MPLSLEQKQAVVAEVHEVARAAHAVLAAEYSGLTVADMTRLREQAKAAGAHVRVVRNTLAKRALADTEFAPMGDALVGPLVLMFSRDEPSAAARVARDFAKDNEKLVVKVLAFEGRLLGGEDLDVLASLPTREEAIARLMAVLEAPVARFVRTVAEPHARLVRTLGAVRDQRQAA